MFKKLVALACLASAPLHAVLQPGPNDLLPAPVLTSAVNNDGTITVSGKYCSIKRNASFIIQFFGNPSIRDSVTEGQDFLGQTIITTGCNGCATFTVTLPPTQFTDPFISADATLLDALGNPTDTSMFSKSIAIS
jgi:hypothetical protein